MSKKLVVNNMLPWEILQTAQLFFKNKGFDHTRIDDITDCLEISNEIFFQCFESLDEILELLWSETPKEKIIVVRKRTYT